MTREGFHAGEIYIVEEHEEGFASEEAMDSIFMIMDPALVEKWMDGSVGRYSPRFKDLEAVNFSVDDGRASYSASFFTPVFEKRLLSQADIDIMIMLNPVAGSRYQKVLNFYKKGLTE